jgi:hypothetical protein
MEFERKETTGVLQRKQKTEQGKRKGGALKEFGGTAAETAAAFRRNSGHWVFLREILGVSEENSWKFLGTGGGAGTIPLGDGVQRESGKEVGGLLLAALSEVVRTHRRDGVHVPHRDRRRGGASRTRHSIEVENHSPSRSRHKHKDRRTERGAVVLVTEKSERGRVLHIVDVNEITLDRLYSHLLTKCRTKIMPALCFVQDFKFTPRWYTLKF